MALSSRREYVSLNCKTIQALDFYNRLGDSDLSRKRLLNAITVNFSDTTAQHIKMYAGEEPLFQLVVNLSKFCGSVLPDPKGTYNSLLEHIIAGSLSEYHTVISSTGERQAALSRCYNHALQNMHLAFNIRLSLTGAPDKAGSKIWDCLNDSIFDLVNQRKESRYEITTIEPEWTSTRERDIGLLLADYILPPGYPILPERVLSDRCNKQTIKNTLFKDCPVKQRMKYVKKAVSLSTYKRIQDADFINNRIGHVCWSLFRYFSEHIQSPYGGSFAEFHITNSLTNFEITYERHGAFEAFRNFTHSIADALSFAYSVRAFTEDGSAEWNGFSEPLCSFIEKHDGEAVTIHYDDVLPKVNRKELFPVVRHVFSRPDMGLWQIPLPGLTHAGE